MAQGPQPKNDSWTVEEIGDMIADPFYCLNVGVHHAYTIPHEPLISEETWVKAMINLIKDEGAEIVLRRLLKNLKGDGSHWKKNGSHWKKK